MASFTIGSKVDAKEWKKKSKEKQGKKLNIRRQNKEREGRIDSTHTGETAMRTRIDSTHTGETAMNSLLLSTFLPLFKPIFIFSVAVLLL